MFVLLVVVLVFILVILGKLYLYLKLLQSEKFSLRYIR